MLVKLYILSRETILVYIFEDDRVRAIRLSLRVSEYTISNPTIEGLLVEANIQ